MPLVVYALAAYVAGLLAGFADSFPFIMLAVAVAGAFGWRHGRAVGLAFGALTIAGVVAARTSQHDAERCARDGMRRQPFRVVVEDSVSPGAYVRAHLERC